MLDMREAASITITFACGMLIMTIWNMTNCFTNIFEFCQRDNVFTYSPKQLKFLITPKDDIIVNPYQLDHLQPDDLSRLIDIETFNFTILNHICEESETTDLLVLVLSAPLNKLNRQIIRETWGRPAQGMKIVFLLGQTNSYIQDSLKMENEKYGDIVQGNFEDSYYNLTYKHVMALKYAAYYCRTAKYVLKADDDIFINMPTLLEFVSKELVPKHVQRLLFCRVLAHSRPKRSWRAKWRVSFDQFKEKKYPTYCQGWCILYSPDAVFTLYSKVQTAKYFWISDVHVTGMMALSTNIIHVSFTPLVLDLKRVDSIINSPCQENITDYFLFGPYQMKFHYVKVLWNILYGKKVCV